MDDNPPTQRDPWVYDLAMRGPIETMEFMKKHKLFPKKPEPVAAGKPVTPGQGILPPKSNPPELV